MEEDKASEQPQQQQTRYRVGYALEAKKVKTFMLPSLLELASEKGLDLIPLDPTKPLSEQGPFHCIFHKLYGQNWARELLGFTGPVVDPLARVELLHSRTTMLEAVSRVRVPFHVTVPNQRLVSLPDDRDIAGFRFPAIAKPVAANGGAGSHKMALVLRPEGLRTLLVGPPVVLQEFINHGGVLFKVYVVGRQVSCVRRPSLADVDISAAGDADSAVISFSQISNAATAAATRDESRLPDGLAEQLGIALGAELGLSLFNFDVIKSSDDDDEKYYVVDINYFPGFAKMPDYERVFTDFLLEIVRGGDNKSK